MAKEDKFVPMFIDEHVDYENDIYQIKIPDLRKFVEKARKYQCMDGSIYISIRKSRKTQRLYPVFNDYYKKLQEESI